VTGAALAGRTTVCLSTYKERENLEPILRALEPLGVRVLVVGDDSPDGTGQLADRLASELDSVSVLHRQRKEGLGPAYLAGFRRARGSAPLGCSDNREVDRDRLFDTQGNREVAIIPTTRSKRRRVLAVRPRWRTRATEARMPRR
jgi:glycosyltransferase involved in cell wall biosynthesis